MRSSNLKLVVIVSASAAGLTAGILWGKSKSTGGGGGGSPPSPPDSGNATWFCSLHAEDVGFNVDNATRTFAAAHALGCRGIRTDVSWSDLEPSQDGWNQTAMDFYTAYFVAAHKAGLDLAVIAIPIDHISA